MAGEVSHVVPFIIRVWFLFSFILIVEFINVEYKVFLFEFLAIDERHLGYFQYSFFSLLRYFFIYPTIINNLLSLLLKSLPIIVRQVTFEISPASILLSWVYHILQKKWFLRSSMLIYEIEIALEMDQYEAIIKVANNIADREDLTMEDWLICIFIYNLQGFFIYVLFLIVIGHILRK